MWQPCQVYRLFWIYGATVVEQSMSSANYGYCFATSYHFMVGDDELNENSSVNVSAHNKEEQFSNLE